MKNWTQTLLIGFAGLSLAFAGCGDDDNNTTTDTSQPADTMTADTSTADTTPTAATDQCVDDEQANLANGLAAATACGTSASCIGFAFSNLAQFETCVQTCMLDETTGAGLSEGCSMCYTKAVRCTAEFCLEAPASCATTPSGEACIACRDDNGCTSGFSTCAGI